MFPRVQLPLEIKTRKIDPEANLHQHRWLSWVIMVFHPSLLSREVSTIRLFKAMSIEEEEVTSAIT